MKMKCLVSTLQVLVFNLLMITLVMSVGAEPPQVISTNPPNGVVGVRPDLDAVYIIFDKPMNWPNVTPENKCVTISKNIRGGALVQWEDNIFHLYRGDPETDLPFGTEVRLTLNPPDQLKTVSGIRKEIVFPLTYSHSRSGRIPMTLLSS